MVGSAGTCQPAAAARRSHLLGGGTTGPFPVGLVKAGMARDGGTEVLIARPTQVLSARSALQDVDDGRRGAVL